MKSEPKKSWMDLYLRNKEEGWKAFLEQKNLLIMGVIKKHVYDHDEAMGKCGVSVQDSGGRVCEI